MFGLREIFKKATFAVKPDQAAGGWFGRIGVVYNAKTQKYVLAGQGGSPNWQFGEYFATSSSPTGPFKFARVQPESLDLDVTGEWSNWKSKEFSLTLPAGKNIITFKSLTDEGAPNIDKVEFVKNEENKDSSDVKPQEETIGIAQRITPRHDVNIRGNSRYFYVNGKSMNTQHHKASRIRVYSK